MMISGYSIGLDVKGNDNGISWSAASLVGVRNGQTMSRPIFGRGTIECKAGSLPS
jgi:hypothetical protein